MKLENRVAIVTGGANGIGRGITLRLAQEGADVVVADIDLDGANKVIQEIETLGRRGLAIKTDVSKSEEVKAMTKTVLDKLGKVDILVNNAGGSARERKSLFKDSTEEVWDYVIGINYKGVLNCCRAVINHMIDRRYGKIVNIGSISADGGSSEQQTVYAGAKGAYISFTMSLAKEVAGYDINVNNISCGPFETEWSDQSPHKARLEQLTGFGRKGKFEEMSAVVAFLVSDEASFITGQNIPVCGLANISSL
ncbi:SDR family NAD(P)-dependent oxidoreductase [Chloroflexota bacterium]